MGLQFFNTFPAFEGLFSSLAKLWKLIAEANTTEEADTMATVEFKESIHLVT